MNQKKLFGIVYSCRIYKLFQEQKYLTVARVAENKPKKPIRGFDFTLSILVGAMKVQNRTNTMVLTIRIPVISSLLFSISHAGVFDANIPTYKQCE